MPAITLTFDDVDLFPDEDGTPNSLASISECRAELIFDISQYGDVANIEVARIEVARVSLGSAARYESLISTSAGAALFPVLSAAILRDPDLEQRLSEESMDEFGPYRSEADEHRAAFLVWSR